MIYCKINVLFLRGKTSLFRTLIHSRFLWETSKESPDAEGSGVLSSLGDIFCVSTAEFSAAGSVLFQMKRESKILWSSEVPLPHGWEWRCLSHSLGKIASQLTYIICYTVICLKNPSFLLLKTSVTSKATQVGNIFFPGWLHFNNIWSSP